VSTDRAEKPTVVVARYFDCHDVSFAHEVASVPHQEIPNDQLSKG
jgi:hypothetical protein